MSASQRLDAENVSPVKPDPFAIPFMDLSVAVAVISTGRYPVAEQFIETLSPAREPTKVPSSAPQAHSPSSPVGVGCLSAMVPTQPPEPLIDTPQLPASCIGPHPAVTRKTSIASFRIAQSSQRFGRLETERPSRWGARHQEAP